MIFKKKDKETTGTTPQVIEVKLNKDYKFMYENFLISNQRELYLLLQEHAGQVDALKFDFRVYKFGYPNDEAMGTHPLAKFGLGFYGLFQVLNSPWTKELCEGNRIHPRHEDKMFDDVKAHNNRIQQDKITEYQERFGNLTDEKLVEKINNPTRFEFEARKAAENILEQRKKLLPPTKAISHGGTVDI